MTISDPVDLRKTSLIFAVMLYRTVIIDISRPENAITLHVNLRTPFTGGMMQVFNTLSTFNRPPISSSVVFPSEDYLNSKQNVFGVPALFVIDQSQSTAFLSNQFVEVSSMNFKLLAFRPS